ncbi:protein CA_C1420-like isoform X1 [Argopecten irradians]|uniref:protein CA_C1420-like isoform X1 n=2 Tax=Argopecten irradians TaxID=31199 RepID=UPI0037136935
MKRCKLLQIRNYLNKTTCTRYGHYNVNMYMFLSLLSLSLCSLADSKITGAFVVPHGGIALAPNHFNTTNATAKEQAWILHKNYRQIGDQIDRSKPDLIFLSTPHGVADLDRFALYLNSAGEGNANTDNIQCPPACFNVSANLAFNVAKDIVRKFNYGFNLTGLSAFGQPGKSDENFPLRWGEVIPLYFIPNLPRIQVIILSQPSRRYTDSVSMIPELLELGCHLYDYLEALEQSVVVMVSADLAHTHDKDGPYGYSDAAEPFDKACGQWAETLDYTSLLVTAANYVDKALSCGYTGMVMLHGMLEAGKLSSWIPTLHANYHPSYYGMMLASFLRHNLLS